jgi:hypothetical protein
MSASTLHIALNALKAHPSWYLFPIMPGEKYPPLIPNNLEDASNDPEQIKKWHAKNFGCCWGLSLRKSRLIVVDVDTKPGKVGAATWNALTSKHTDELGDFGTDETFVVETPSGGFHFYFNEANGVQHACRLGVHGFGADVDSPNYVLLAGCRINVTIPRIQDVPPCTLQVRYRTVQQLPIAPAPAWFGIYLQPSNAPDAEQDIPAAELDSDAAIAWGIHHLTHDAKSCIEGQNGEHTLLMTAARLKDRGISEGKAIDLLAEFYNVPKAPDGEPQHPYCEPLWSIGEGPPADRLDVKVHNAWLYLKQTSPGAHTAEADFADDVEVFAPGFYSPEPIDRMASLAQRRKARRGAQHRKRANQWSA